MSIIITTEKAMVSCINYALATGGRRGDEMMVVPMVIADTPAKAAELLYAVNSYDPRIDAHNLPYDAVGKVKLNAKTTVHDDLNALESETFVPVHEMDLALRCAVGTHVKGKTRKVNIKPFGEVIVDLAQFSQKSGHPIDCDEVNEYSVFLREVTDKKSGGPKTMLIVLKGTTDTSNGNGGKATALQSMMARLEARRKTGQEPCASFHAKDLDSAWQLFNNALFNDLLSWWKFGSTFEVKSDDNQGIHIGY